LFKKAKKLVKGQLFLSSEFQKQLAKSNLPHWDVATTQDSAFASTFPSIQKRGLLHKFGQWYSKKLIRTTVSSPELNTLLIGITNSVIFPLKLFSPKVIYYVLTKK